MKEQKNISRLLNWPWNLLVYGLLLAVLRIWAIPVILFLTGWQKKHQPDGLEEGYCLQRTRNRLAWLVWAALFLVAGLACGMVFITQLRADHSAWKTEDYVTLVVAGILAVGGMGIGLYEGYTDLRDSLVPEKSRLAQSIRSQLPYPEEAPSVRELFAMVDKDIRENGQWFDRMAVGKEWVLGDDASSIPRIRVVFSRDEIQHHHSGKRTTTNRVIELYILDDRRQMHVTALRDPNELSAVMDCLRLRAPEALFRSYSEYTNYCTMSEEEWAQLLLEYQRRKTGRESSRRLDS